MFFSFLFVLDWHGGMITRRPEREKKAEKDCRCGAVARHCSRWPKAKVDCSGQGNIGRMMVELSGRGEMDMTILGITPNLERPHTRRQENAFCFSRRQPCTTAEKEQGDP